MTNKAESVDLAAALTIAWLGNAHTRPNADDVPAFFRSMFDAVEGLAGGSADKGVEEAAPSFTPAVSARKSLADPEFIVSMLDGRRYRSLTRHLSSRGITPDQYRDRYGLPASYPMVAPGYTAARSALSKSLGLGRKKVGPVEPEPAAPPPPVAAKPKRARKSVAEAKAAAKAHLEG
jgi:predicted transcriptional regulator